MVKKKAEMEIVVFLTPPIGLHILAHDLWERCEVSDSSVPMVRVMEISQEMGFIQGIFIRAA